MPARLLPCGQLPVDRAFLCADGVGTSRRVVPRDGKSDAAARGSCLAAAATGVQITPYIAVYGMRAGLSFMQNNVASEPMIVQVLMGELSKKLSERSFPNPCQSRGLRRARTGARGRTFTYPAAQ